MFRSYTRNRRDRELERCQENISSLEEAIDRCGQEILEIRRSKSECEKEIHESDSFLANVRDNERMRKLNRDIKARRERIEAFDMEEAARARREFDEKYAPAKKREGDMEAEVCTL